MSAAFLRIATALALSWLLFGGQPLALSTDLGDFLEVSAGPFTMGADRARDPEAFDNERWSPSAPEGSVFVPTFFIAAHAVTVGEFSTFVRATNWRIDPRAVAGPATQPVGVVSWPDALAYCRWLEASWKAGSSTPARIKELLAQGWRVTLPNEAEWEKAARVLGADRFVWGRVSEWTSSPYQPYPYDPADDRTGLVADALWVIRGGVSESAAKPRATARTGADPGARRPFIGFRVALVRR
jgi:formylglycine-generating enzyme required for sulfatase activity